MKNAYGKFVLLGFVMVILAGIVHSGATEVFAAVENVPTIRMGDNAPMTRDELMEWSSQRGIRHFNIDGRIYPVCIFFNGAIGKSFRYGELNGKILPVILLPGVASENRSVLVQEISDANEIEQNSRNFTPVIFTDSTPILFSDDELTAMIESVPHQNPLDIRSSITLPNRRLTESELTSWVDEYNEMSGATAFEIAVVREVNRARAQYGLRSLALDPTLMMSARLKTQEFGDLQYFGHHSPVHGSPTEAARMVGFEGWWVAETITQSGSSSTPSFRSTPEGVVRGMLASTRGHKEILLNPNTFSVGFGSFFSPHSTGRNGNMSHMFYYATKFGFIE